MVMDYFTNGRSLLAEVFPTVIRGKGVATCEIMGGVGLFLCPMIVYLVHFSDDT